MTEVRHDAVACQSRTRAGDVRISRALEDRDQGGVDMHLEHLDPSPFLGVRSPARWAMSVQSACFHSLFRCSLAGRLEPSDSAQVGNRVPQLSSWRIPPQFRQHGFQSPSPDHHGPCARSTTTLRATRTFGTGRPRQSRRRRSLYSSLKSADPVSWSGCGSAA